ncbi:MAG: 16S rRNA (cytidine(1402)-2'-O)-methyltransferase, partial [Desulfovibrionaceae bacterium]|nr:16S rRNA (cytidine(1402)-2'-O)-methyltransferase [Desulfovibrionaceae bacterium]
MSGILWIVGTPIGNRDDISSRAIEVLSHVEYIVAEDTRVTRVLLSALGIYEKKLLSLYDHVELEKSEKIFSLLLEGREIALVSDAGMPCISDPGYVLVRRCHQHNIPVRVVPGASSITTLLAGSGIPAIPCTFLGFLPRGRGERIRT